MPRKTVPAARHIAPAAPASDMAEKVSSKVRLSADSITAALRSMILEGAIGIGVQLKQEALAQRFGVSRIPVREALKRLEAEGLIEHVAHQGSIVAPKSREDLMETLDVRIGLETRAIKLAIPNMTTIDFKSAQDVMARFQASDEPREWAELNLEFHLCLYRPSGRSKLVRMIEDLVRGIDIQMRAQQSSAFGRKSAQSEHKALLRACMERDVVKAVSLLEEHIEHTQASLRLADLR